MPCRPLRLQRATEYLPTAALALLIFINDAHSAYRLEIRGQTAE